ncbi:hypothetical protein PCL1606_35590 [Pseudomonas chlororaphis]|uniref:Uncharacterized protein n=1 Tax=Pseudomonas chlororaphis TaxID=587753 RepID=A0A0D5Y206_9PSED|nr:hypothetical protein PCL1606_35590 [Pseudomonas chlororaphis]
MLLHGACLDSLHGRESSPGQCAVNIPQSHGKPRQRSGPAFFARLAGPGADKWAGCGPGWPARPDAACGNVSRPGLGCARWGLGR